jgi:hypothetical protein
VKSVSFGNWDAKSLEALKAIDNKIANEQFQKNVPNYIPKPTERDS